MLAARTSRPAVLLPSPLGEGLGKRGVTAAPTQALSPTLSQREREIFGRTQVDLNLQR
jgi:hypothetical protein